MAGSGSHISKSKIRSTMMGFTIVILRFGNLRMNNKRVAPEDTIISYYENGNCAKTGHVLRLGRKRSKSILRCLIKRNNSTDVGSPILGHRVLYDLRLGC